MKTGASNFTTEQVQETRKDDLSDIPESKDFPQGYLQNRKTGKKAISIRIDLDNLTWLQSEGVKDYQKKLNAALRWARNHGCPLKI